MSRMKKGIVILAAAVLFLPSAPRADVPQVGLQEAFQLALEQNPELVAMGNSVEAARERVGAAKSHLLPKVTLEERYMRTDNPTYAFSSKLNQSRFEDSDFVIDSLNHPEDIDDFMTSISIVQPLYSREASLGVDMARTQSEALDLDFGKSRKKVLLDVVEAFIGGATSRQFRDVAQKGLEDAISHLEIARSRVEAGLGLESDLLRAEVSVKEMEERLVSAQKNTSLANRTLGLILGQDGPVEAAGEVIPMPDLKPVEYYEEASSSRDDLLAMAKRVHNARLNIDMSAARFSPTAGLGGSYQINSHQFPLDEEGSSYQVSAFIRWDIYNGGLKGHAGSDARFSLLEAEAYYNGLKKEIIFRINQAYLNVQEASRGKELASSRLSLADETVRLMEKRYENSLATVVELLDAQTSLDSARADLVAKTNSQLIFLARLMFQSNLIEQEFLAKN
ncbi:MAG: TolC family protein [bacterium]|nr:TolC family protein [bacterium]MDT8366822.1 TolC family protein [bacterium]